MKKANVDKQQTFWVYILLCRNNSYYTGYTTDLEKRYLNHVNGIACKYTRSFKPTKIAQSWKIENNKSLAMKVECYIKQLSRAEKDKIISNPTLVNMRFSIDENNSLCRPSII